MSSNRLPIFFFFHFCLEIRDSDWFLLTYNFFVWLWWFLPYLICLLYLIHTPISLWLLAKLLNSYHLSSLNPSLKRSVQPWTTSEEGISSFCSPDFYTFFFSTKSLIYCKGSRSFKIMKSITKREMLFEIDFDKKSSYSHFHR